MTQEKPSNDEPVSPVPELQTPLVPEASHEIYVYASSGIAERKGKVPIWLWAVAVSLVIWSVYYLFAYWNPAAPSG